MPSLSFYLEPYQSSTVISNYHHQVFIDWIRTKQGEYLYNGVDAEKMKNVMPIKEGQFFSDDEKQKIDEEQKKLEQESFEALTNQIAQNLLGDTSPSSKTKAEKLLPHLTQSGILHQAPIGKTFLSLNLATESQWGSVIPDQNSRCTTMTLQPSGKILITETMNYLFPLRPEGVEDPKLKSVVISELTFDEKGDFKVNILKSEFESSSDEMISTLRAYFDEKKISSKLHNYNSWSYLKEIKRNLSAEDIKDLPGPLQSLFQEIKDEFVPEQEYRMLYTQMIHILNDYQYEISPGLAKVYQHMYLNHNDNLNYTYQWISNTVDSQTPSTSESLAQRIKHGFLQDDVVDGTTPLREETNIVRLQNMFASDFRPMANTSIPHVRYTPWLDRVKQIRMGTQAELIKGNARPLPSFEAFLRGAQDKDKITHLYFNLLRRDQGSFERNKEAAMTGALDGLESFHPNCAVITLPADGGYMKKEDAIDNHISLNENKNISYPLQMAEFLRVAMEQEEAKNGVKDFHISDRIREKVGLKRKDDPLAEEQMRKLLEDSASAVGIPDDALSISPAQRQAIWFHFTKYALPNYLIQKLEPKTLNFSCKDGIDRGGVASAYYNLIKSFEEHSTRTMTQEEFNRELHAPPTMVKGRGMNHHLSLIWNAVNAYVEANYEKLLQDTQRKWLIEWRDLNCPKQRADEVLNNNLVHLNAVFSNNLPVRSVLTQVDALKQNQLVRPSILIETLIHTRNLASKEGLNRPQEIRLKQFVERTEKSHWYDFFKNIFNWFRNKTSSVEHEKDLKAKLQLFKGEAGSHTEFDSDSLSPTLVNGPRR